VYVDNPGARDDCLFDCGTSNAVRFTTIPFLRSRGVNHLSHFVLTHGDFQDISGAIPFKNEVPVQHVLTTPVKYRSPIYRRVLSELETNGPAITMVSQGDSAAGWRVLHPRAEDKFAQADDASLVVIREVFSTRVLLLSDLGREGQEALALRTEDLRADIVVTGLPEKSEPVSWALLQRIQPKLIVVADAEFPAPARAGRALQERLRAGPARVLFTRNTGGVEISITPSGWRCRVARPADASESGWWR
jgi:competence protein ComEC